MNMTVQQFPPPTNEYLPHVHLRVVPLNQVLEHVGVEPHGRQTDDAVTLPIQTLEVRTERDQALQHWQAAGTGRQQDWGWPQAE